MLLSIQKPHIMKKIPNITNLATKTALNAKAADVKSIILDLTSVVLKVALNTKAI